MIVLQVGYPFAIVPSFSFLVENVYPSTLDVAQPQPLPDALDACNQLIAKIMQVDAAPVITEEQLVLMLIPSSNILALPPDQLLALMTGLRSLSNHHLGEFN